MLKQQLEEKRIDNEFLKQQLTLFNQTFTQFNKQLEDKTAKKDKKFFGIF